VARDGTGANGRRDERPFRSIAGRYMAEVKHIVVRA
jgi:hypothetical protein